MVAGADFPEILAMVAGAVLPEMPDKVTSTVGDFLGVNNRLGNVLEVHGTGMQYPPNLSGPSLIWLHGKDLPALFHP